MAHGGKRPGAGRKPGAVSKAKRQLSEMAKGFAPAALKTLEEIAASGASDAARVSAAIAILDRAYGRPPQNLEVSGPDGGPIATIDATRLSSEALRELSGAFIDEDPETDAGGSDSD